MNSKRKILLEILVAGIILSSNCWGWTDVAEGQNEEIVKEIYIKHTTGGMLGGSTELITIYKEDKNYLIKRCKSVSSASDIAKKPTSEETKCCVRKIEENRIRNILNSIKPSLYHSEGFITDYCSHYEVFINTTHRQIWAESSSNMGSLGPWNVISQTPDTREIFKMQGDKTLAAIGKLPACDVVAKLKGDMDWEIPSIKSLLVKYLPEKIDGLVLENVKHINPFEDKNLEKGILDGVYAKYYEIETSKNLPNPDIRVFIIKVKDEAELNQLDCWLNPKLSKEAEKFNFTKEKIKTPLGIAEEYYKVGKGSVFYTTKEGTSIVSDGDGAGISLIWNSTLFSVDARQNLMYQSAKANAEMVMNNLRFDTPEFKYIITLDGKTETIIHLSFKRPSAEEKCEGKIDSMSCEQDSDCICENKGCFRGNREYYKRCVEKDLNCPNLCPQEGFCVNNRCKFIPPNPQLCFKPEYTLSEISGCLAGMASIIGDKSVCNLVLTMGKNIQQCKNILTIDSSVGTKKRCIDLSTKKIKRMCEEQYKPLAPKAEEKSYCERMLEVEDRDRCYRELAEQKNDISLCEKIHTDFRREYCYMSFAKLTNKNELCEKIEHEDRKNECYFALAEKNLDSSLCRNDWCRRNLASLTKDVSVCEKMTSQSSRDICYRDVAKASGDFSICEKIRTSSPANTDCYIKFAISTSNPSLCEKALDSNFCYTNLAEAMKDVSLCKKVQKRDTKDSCYSYVAKATSDSSLCENISKERTKNICYSQTAKTVEECKRISEKSKKWKEICIKRVLRK